MIWNFRAETTAEARDARAAFVAVLAREGVTADDLWSAECIFGELLANAIMHGSVPIDCSLEWFTQWPVLVVRDAGGGFNVRTRRLPSIFAEGGRGLYVVRALAIATHVQSAGQLLGSEVIVRLRLSRPAPAEVRAPAIASFSPVPAR